MFDSRCRLNNDGRLGGEPGRPYCFWGVGGGVGCRSQERGRASCPGARAPVQGPFPRAPTAHGKHQTTQWQGQPGIALQKTLRGAVLYATPWAWSAARISLRRVLGSAGSILPGAGRRARRCDSSILDLRAASIRGAERRRGAGFCEASGTSSRSSRRPMTSGLVSMRWPGPARSFRCQPGRPPRWTMDELRNTVFDGDTGCSRCPRCPGSSTINRKLGMQPQLPNDAPGL